MCRTKNHYQWLLSTWKIPPREGKSSGIKGSFRLRAVSLFSVVSRAKHRLQNSRVFFFSKSVKKSLTSLPSLALCLQPRSWSFIWLLARTWISKTRDKQMATRVTEGARRAALVSHVSRLRCSRARALLSLNLNKKRDCSQSRVVCMKYNSRQGNSLNSPPFPCRLKRISMGLTVSCQLVNWSNDLKFNRQPGKKVIFYLQPSKGQTIINPQKVSRNLKFHILSWCSRTSGSWTNSKVKNSCSQVLKNTLSRHYRSCKTLHFAYIWKHFEFL